MTHLTRLAGAALVVALAAWLHTTAHEPKTPTPAVPKSPLTPDAEKATFQLPPGLRIDLVAAEPLIESPVACSFDEKGRLWVAEYRDYPNGPGPGKPGECRIKVLEDVDGDGRFDKATTFADNLLFANCVLPWKNGAIVTAAPNILYLKDTNGDLKADETEVLYEGFVAGNPQLRVSHPALGPDGWIAVANGLRSNSEVRRTGKPDRPAIPLSGKDFRFDLVHDRAESIPGMGQFGNTFDRWGNRFVCDNRHHLRHVVFPQDPTARNPLLVVPSLLQDTDSEAKGGSRVYPLSRNWTTSNLHAGQFTAACGVFVDQGGLLPAPFNGAAYTCDPTGNLVHCETLAPNGASFTSKPWKNGVEFLASPDEWFRPVSLANAPDGSLFVVDMYRAVIEHPEFMPAELKNRPDLLLGKDRGRIWRIAPAGDAPKKYEPITGDATTLAKTLSSPNGWARTTAQRLLLTSDDPAIPAALQQQAGSASPEGSILAAYLLRMKGQNTDALVERLAASSTPQVQAHAARLLELGHKPGTPVPAALLKMATSNDDRVLFAAAIALGAWDDDAIVQPLSTIGWRMAPDRWARLAVASSAGKRTAKLVTALLENTNLMSNADPLRNQMLQEFCEVIGSGRDPAEIAAVLQAGSKVERPATKSAVISGLASGMSRRGTSFPSFLASLKDKSVAATAQSMLTTLTAPALDASAAEPVRVEAVRLMAYAPSEAVESHLKRLVDDPDQAPLIRAAAIRSWAAHSSKAFAPTLLKSWRSFTPSLRTEVLELLLRGPERVKALLDAVEAGTVKPGDIDPARARRLIGSKDAAVAARAVKLLKDSLPADRKEVLAKYREALTLKSDPRRGQEAFKKVCAACHVVAGIGTQVGPDISDTRTKTPEMLLTDILNPNAAIDGNYIAFTVINKDGKQFQGVIASESSASITLKRENNQSDTILRADVEEIRSSGQSLMPDGLEKNLTPQEVADLIRFLKDWRYLDGATPRGTP